MRSRPHGVRRHGSSPMHTDPLDTPSFRLFLQMVLDQAEAELNERRRRHPQSKASRTQAHRKPRNAGTP